MYQKVWIVQNTSAGTIYGVKRSEADAMAQAKDSCGPNAEYHKCPRTGMTGYKASNGVFVSCRLYDVL